MLFVPQHRQYNMILYLLIYICIRRLISSDLSASVHTLYVYSVGRPCPSVFYCPVSSLGSIEHLKKLDILDIPFLQMSDIISDMIFGDLSRSSSFLFNVVTPFSNLSSISGCEQSGRWYVVYYLAWKQGSSHYPMRPYFSSFFLFQRIFRCVLLPIV